MDVAVGEQVTMPFATATSSAPSAVFDEAGPMIASTSVLVQVLDRLGGTGRVLSLVDDDVFDVVAEHAARLVDGVDGVLERRTECGVDSGVAGRNQCPDRQHAVVDTGSRHLGGGGHDGRSRLGLAAPGARSHRRPQAAATSHERSAEAELVASSPHVLNSTV